MLHEIHEMKIREIIILYGKVKSMITFAEESELPKHKSNTYMQPRIEFASAFDHLVRALAVVLERPTKEDTESFKKIEEQLFSVYEHVHRAYFDTCDWICIICNEAIYDELKSFESGIINEVIPDYYKIIKPFLESKKKEIAKIRDSKSLMGNALIDDYEPIITEIIKYYERIKSCTSSIIEIQSSREKEKKKASKTVTRRFVINTVVATVATVATIVAIIVRVV